MNSVEIAALIVAALALGGLIFTFVYTFPISKRVYKEQLVRTSPQKWARVCSCEENEEQLSMWNAGIEWANGVNDKMRKVHIENDGFNLYGEYYDFGGDRCVIILPGRCESLVYSYYFAPPYEKAGFNVLVIDTRCHGKSDGVYNTIGVKESRDVLAWAKLMHDNFNNSEVWFHGICIGTSAGIFALSDKACPDFVKGFVTEGCFVSFRETFKNHMIADKRPLFPVLDTVMLLINHHTGTNVYLQKPIRAIKKIPKTAKVLFLYGEKDVFSVPKMSRKLFAACAAEDKKLVWFEKGGHSHLRINNLEKYDNEIIEFFKER